MSIKEKNKQEPGKFSLISQISRMSYRVKFFLLLGVVFLFRLWFVTSLPLSGDESYHWEWSRNLAMGYYDHPGVTAYLIFLSTSILGKSTELTVRLVALIMLTGTTVICFFLARRVVLDRGGSEPAADRSGFMAGLLIIIIPVYAALSGYISTDPPVIFFWALAMHMLYLAFTREKWLYWIIAGLAYGLALQSKFLSFFLVGSIGLFVLISPKDRKWLARPQSYVAFACALLVFAPLVWWNYQNEWATFMFNFVYRQKQGSFSFDYIPVSIASQMLALSPVIFPVALFAIYRSIRDWFEKKDRASLFLGLCSFIPIGYFVYLSFKWQVDPHWPAAGWLGAIVYLACYWTDPERSETKFFKRLRATAIISTIVMMVVVHIIVHIPPKFLAGIQWAYSRNPDINTKQLTELYGWRELGERVSEVRNEMLASSKDQGTDVFVIADQYGLCGNVSFYTPDQVRTHLWSKRRTHGENYRYWDDFSSMKGQDAVFVLKREKRVSRNVQKLREHFEKVDEADRLEIFVQDIKIRDFFIVRCYGYDGREPDFENYLIHEL